MTFASLVEAFQAVELTPYSYSGRGMFGATCLAVTVDDPNLDVVELLQEYLCDGEEEEAIEDCLYELSNFLGEPYMDNMGFQYVVYFPRVQWLD